MDELIQELKELIINDKALLFERFKNILLPKGKVYNDVIFQESRFKQNNEVKNKGTVSVENTAMEDRRIDEALLDLVDAMQPEHLKDKPGQQLNHSHVFLCDRVPQNDAFVEASEKLKTEKAHFYYLYGFYKEKHKSLFDRFAIGFVEGGSKVINIEVPIPYSGKMDVFKIGFIKEFCKKFEIKVNDHEELEKKSLQWICKNSVPIQGLEKNDYVCVFISMSEWDWDPTMTPELTRWFINEYCKPELSDESPNFLFFFSVSYETDDSPVEQEVRQMVEEGENVVGLPELEKVGFRDIARWFSRFNFIKTADGKDAASIRDANFDRRESYHMDKIETDLTRIIDEFNEQFI